MVQERLVALARGGFRQWARSCVSERSALFPCLYNPSRTFSSKLFVGGLSYHTTEEMVRNAFAQHGDVVDVRIITDRETGQSRGFGFITFATESEAEAARSKMNNHLLDGRFIRVDLASSRAPPSPGSPRPSGYAASSSSSGFTFTNPGTRPPPVEDWSPLPFRAGQAAQAPAQGTTEIPLSSPSYQGSPDNCGIGTDSSASGASGQQAPCTASSNVASQDGGASQLRSNRFDAAASSNAASSTTQNTAASSDVSGRPPDFKSNMPWQGQGMTANGASATNMTATNAGQGFGDRSSPEAGTSPTQTAKIKLDSNFTSRTGSRSGGAGRPPSVINLGSATYDFSKFPEFDASVLKKSMASSEAEEPKKRMPFERSKLAPRKAETWQKKLTEETVPPADGPLYNFCLSSVPDALAPSNAGFSPHGGFSLNVNLDELPEAEPVRLPYSIFTARTLPPLDLPWLTPEADNWSPIGKPPRRIEDSPYSPFSPDLKDDPEFWWDPYDFDPEAKLLKDAVAEEPSTETNATIEPESEAKKLDKIETEVKPIKEAESEAKVAKELEVDEILATKVATS